MMVAISAIFTYTKFVAFCIGQQDDAKWEKAVLITLLPSVFLAVK
jgi:hypothetical protein